MKKGKINIIRTVLFLAAFCTVYIGTWYFIESLKASEEPKGIIFSILFYAFIIYATLFIKASDENLNYKFTDITTFGFYFWVLLVPIIIIGIITYIYIKHGDAVFAVPAQAMSIIGVQSNSEAFLFICSIIQAIFIIIWFMPKINDKDTDEHMLMKLDYLSTVAIIPLTAVWVIYNLDNVKYGFALILCVFMMIQVSIKRAIFIKNE